MNKYLKTAVFVGSLGGLVFGYDLGALAAATLNLRGQFHLAPWIFGLLISSSVWGTVCGSILTGQLADRMSRHKLIALCSILYMFAAAAITIPAPAELFFIFLMRFLCGIAVGGFTVGCPLYLSEIAPIALRGRIVSVFQIQIGIGVILAFSVGAISAHLTTSGAAWRWSLGLGALPALVLFLLVRFVLHRGHQIFVNGSDDKSPEIQPSLVVSGPSRQRLFRKRNTRLILVATSIALFNQLSGVNILLLYLLDVLSSAGISFLAGHTYTVLISCLSLLATVLGMSFVDRLGRKPLLYLGSAGMAVCLLTLGLTIPRHLMPSLYLIILVSYNACFAFSQGTVVWVYLSELFPPGLRGLGQGYGSSVHWIANAMLVSVFPIVQHSSSVRIFYTFALMMILQILVIWLWYPETQGTFLGSFAMADFVRDDRL